MFREFIQNYFFVIVNILFLLVFLQTNTVFNRKVTRQFVFGVLLLIVIVMTEYMDYVLSFSTTPSLLRAVAVMTGYILRPFLIFTLITILRYKSRKECIIMAIPAMFNTVVELTALFGGLAFYYDESNQFVRGPLGYTPHICSLIYLIVILFLSIQHFKQRHFMEACINLTMVSICLLSSVLEAFYQFHGLIRMASSLSLTFFFMYLCAQNFKRDALTRTLNRHSFYRDAEIYKNNLIAVLSIDLNDLKQINDSEGHAAGDKAIVITAECIQKHLMKGCFLYRTGGDEFMVLCQKNATNMEQLHKMIDLIYRTMEQTPYRCSIGMAEYRKGESFNSLCARADEEMYQIKREWKKKNSNLRELLSD